VRVLDRVLQRWRMAKVVPWLRTGMRVLDVGAADGTLARVVPGLREYVGLDPHAQPSVSADRRIRMLAGRFPDDAPPGPFDAVVMLAVLEHFPDDVLARAATACAELIAPGGYLLLTVPSPRVDDILAVLLKLRLLDGMGVEEHHHFDVAATPDLFVGPAFELVVARHFQLGLNNLYVFRRAMSRKLDVG
jgi:2-polyprenyl-3-methyl-5-hydroxy-6-metoxy-1,4-benzoquinol methylase